MSHTFDAPAATARVSAAMAALLRRWAGLLAIVCCMVSLVPAQGAVTGEILSVGIGGVRGRGGTYRCGSWVPVRVRLHNDGSSQVEVYLAVEQIDLDGDRLRSRSRLSTLTPYTFSEGDRDVWLYYWPSPNDDGKGVTSVVVLDKSQANVLSRIEIPNLVNRRLPANETPGFAIPDTGGHNTRFAVVLGNRSMGLESYVGALGGNAMVRPAVITSASELPEQALGLDGVDVVVWNADEVSAPTVGAEFQRKALLDWVRAGGHLVVVVGDKWQELRDAGGDAALSEALPMVLTGTRSLPTAEMFGYYFGGAGQALADFRAIKGPFTQATGTVKPQGRVIGPAPQKLAEGGVVESTAQPLAVTGPYGVGHVTLVTVNVNNGALHREPDPDGAFTEYWLSFWQNTMGWRGSVSAQQRGGQLVPRDVVAKRLRDNDEVNPTVPLILGASIGNNLDTKEQTQVRVLLAVLFLAIYWILAGPGGHVVLRVYKRTHWSWWIFGGTVVVAALLAAGTVFLMRITAYQVRHHTYVSGVVNSKDVSVTAFYGVLAPSSQAERIEMPESTGLAYIAPLNEPVLGQVKSYTNTRRYEIDNVSPTTIEVPFRQTLKKLQARWTGELGGITGEAALNRSVVAKNPIVGRLTNVTGYDLNHVRIIYTNPNRPDMAFAYSAEMRGTWASGATIDLGTQFGLTVDADGSTVGFNDLVKECGLTQSDRGRLPIGAMQSNSKVHERRWIAEWGDEFLSIFPELAAPEQAMGRRGSPQGRLQLCRYYTRMADRSAAIRTYGAVLIARAGDVANERYVSSPVHLRVADRLIKSGDENRGQVIFSYALPLRMDSAPPAKAP